MSIGMSINKLVITIIINQNIIIKIINTKIMINYDDYLLR